MTPTKSLVRRNLVVKLFLAGIGGFIGSTLRYAVTGYVQTWTKSIDFPYGTLAVNLIGCFAIGFLSYLAETRGVFTAQSRTLVFIGIIGGVHSLSTLCYQTTKALPAGRNALARSHTSTRPAVLFSSSLTPP